MKKGSKGEVRKQQVESNSIQPIIVYNHGIEYTWRIP